MAALGNGTLETGVERIAGEEGQDIGFVGKPWMGAVVVHEGLEARDPANRFGRARS